MLFTLFVLIGMNLRTVLLAVPPILPLIQHDLDLSHTEIGFLTALPVLLMGAGAWPAGLLMARLGGRRVVAVGLALIAVGGVLRAVGAGALPLYVFTALLSVGIALAQTSTVALVRIWFPERIGLASALYTDGIISGEALGAGLTIPLLTHLLGANGWRASFIAWSLPLIAVLALWLLLAPEGRPATDDPAMRAVQTGEKKAAVRVAGRPLWLMAAHLGLLSGCCSLIYFNMNAWTAPFNSALGQSSVTPASLAILNASQLPVAFCITVAAQRLTGRRWPFVISGVLCLIAMAGWTWTPWVWQPLWAAVFGGSTVAVLVLGIALPPYFGTRSTVAQLVGGALAISYLLSFSGQLVGGWLWDVSGQPIFAFIPVVAAGIALIGLALALPHGRPQP